MTVPAIRPTAIRPAFKAAFLAVALSLGACASPPPPSFPEITFAHLPTITLDVAKIEVVDKFAPSADKTHVEGRVPVAPKTALRNWARDRLRAGGAAGVAVFTIEDASVIETDLAINKDLKAQFTKEQAQRYDAAVRVTLRLEGLPSVTEAVATASANRSQTVREDANVNQRDTILFELTEALMREFDPAMSASIRRHLGRFVH